MCIRVCLWLLAWGLFWMTGGDWRWWSLTLLDLKLNGQINRCCHLPLWNHLLASTPIRRQHRSLIDTPHLPQRQGGNLSWRIRALGRRNKSRKWQITRGGGERKKSFDKSYFAHAAVFMMCLYQLWICQQSDMKHGELSRNPIWNGQDKVPRKFRGTAWAGRRC